MVIVFLFSKSITPSAWKKHTQILSAKTAPVGETTADVLSRSHCPSITLYRVQCTVEHPLVTKPRLEA